MGPANHIRRDALLLARRDQRFAPALKAAGPQFQVVVRGGGLGSLLHLILGQQVSVDAASAMFRRLEESLSGAITAGGLLELDDATLKRCGFTRQKMGYARGLATTITGGDLDLDALERLSDDEVIESLLAFKGIGRWTAECYLVFALGRRDVLPAGDMALQVGWRDLARLRSRPDETRMRRVSVPWSPHRTAAAWLIWHWYLTRRGRRVPS